MEDTRVSPGDTLQLEEPHFSSPTTMFTDETDDLDDGQQEDVEDAIHPYYDYKNIISDVQLQSEITSKPPDFILKHSGTLHRTIAVKRSNKKGVIEKVEGELEWVVWDDNNGFWKLEDEDGYEKIVKYVDTGKKGYRVYNGVEEGFAPEPVGWPRHGRAPIDIPVTADSSNDEDMASKHVLRQRSKVQKTPFSTEQKAHKRRMAGRPATSSDMEDARKDRHRGKRVSNGSSKSRALESRDRAADTYANLETTITEATLFTSMRDSETMTIPLKMTNSAQELFDKLSTTWQSHLSGRCTQITAKCAWKVKNGEYRVIESVDETFAVLADDIRRAPCWANGEACEVEMFVEG